MFTLGPLPIYSATTQVLPNPGEYLRLCTLLYNRHRDNKKYGPKERTGQSSKNSNEEIANLSNAEFKTLVIRMLTEMVEYG